MITWLPGQEKTLNITWSTLEFEAEISSDKPASSIEFRAACASGHGKLYIDECSIECGVEVKEQDITYVTKFDHHDQLPASIQHHLLAEPYLHPDKGTVKTSTADTVSSWLADKLVEGANVTLAEVDGANGKALQISASGGPGGSGGFDPTEITGDIEAVSGKLYTANNITCVTISLPATASYGFFFGVDGKGAGGWKVQAQPGQYIHVGRKVTKSGGYIVSTDYNDTAWVYCLTANTNWKVPWSSGSIDVEVT